MQFGTLRNGFRNTDFEASVMGENWRGYGCKECLCRV